MEIRTVESFLPYFEGIRARTNRVMAVIPPERFDWTHRPGAFTFADLIRHLGATERYMFAENAQGLPSRYPGHGRELADGPEAVLGFLARLHAESIEILGRLTPADLAAPCITPAGTPIATWKWLRAMVEHEVHHRGQIYLMLGMLGIPTPPIYGLTSEEVKARSQPL
ncbi:MAG TPA: DinB family protein [Thermoanaerobaculia bacterium]|nr:DinB family protein [Thermoanaerobaculia bacterium]